MPPTLATVLLDPPTTLLAGAVVALVSTKLLRKEPDAETARVVRYAALWSVAYTVAVGFMFFWFPDWMFAYLTDAKDVLLPAVFLVFGLVLVVCGIAGAAATSWLIIRKQLGAAIALALGALLFLLLISWLQSSQYAVTGSHAEYLAGTAPKLFDTPRAKLGVNLATLVAGVAGVAILGLRIRDVRRA